MKSQEQFNRTNSSGQFGEFPLLPQQAMDYQGDPSALQGGATEVFGLTPDHLRSAEISAANRESGRPNSESAQLDQPFGLGNLIAVELPEPLPVSGLSQLRAKDSIYSSGLRGDGDPMPPGTGSSPLDT